MCLFNFMAVTICSDFGAQENQVCHCFHCFPVYLPWSDGTGYHDLHFLNVGFESWTRLIHNEAGGAVEFLNPPTSIGGNFPFKNKWDQRHFWVWKGRNFFLSLLQIWINIQLNYFYMAFINGCRKQLSIWISLDLLWLPVFYFLEFICTVPNLFKK